jgi:hypothetical protein
MTTPLRYLWPLPLLLLLPGSTEAQQYGGTIYCNAAAQYDVSTNGLTKLIAAAPTGGIYICGYIITAQATVNAGPKYGTSVSTACDTGATAVTPIYHFAAGAPPIVDIASNYKGMFVQAGNDVCLSTSAGSAVQAIVYYFQQGR